MRSLIFRSVRERGRSVVRRDIHRHEKLQNQTVHRSNRVGLRSLTVE